MQLPAANFYNNNARTEGEGKQTIEDILAFIRQSLLGGEAVDSKTLAGDTFTPTRAAHTLDTEAAAATDNLADIVQTNHPDGSLLLISTVADARNIVVKHLAGGTGQIQTLYGADFTLDVATQFMLLQRRGTNWVEIYRGGTPANYALSAIVRYTAGSGTYTKPANVRAIRVKLKGGGGGGGGAQADVTGGGGGDGFAGAGGGAEGQDVEILITAPGASYAYAVGAAGTAGVATGGVGGTGGDTTFGTLTAKGGLGGKGVNMTEGGAFRTVEGGLGGAGAIVANAGSYVNGKGQPGQEGGLHGWTNGTLATRFIVRGGAGGGAGGGASVEEVAGAGQVGNPAEANSGGGGGGACAEAQNNNTVNAAGGAGGSGDIVIEEYV